MKFCFKLSKNEFSGHDYNAINNNCRSFFKKIGLYMLDDFDKYDFFNSIFTSDKFTKTILYAWFKINWLSLVLVQKYLVELLF